MMTLPPIHKGDWLRLFNGNTGVSNFNAAPDDTHANYTRDDDPHRFGIPIHNDARTITEIWRDGLRIYPPEIVQERLFT